MDQLWQAHLQGRPHARTRRNPPACPALDELAERQSDINDWFTAYASSLADTARDEMVELVYIRGGAGEMTREAILLHVVNHATYHRGHIADMLYHCSVPPPTIDLPVFLRGGAD